MAVYTVAEARNNLTKLLNRVEAGEEIHITRRGKPIARIVPDAPVATSLDAPKSFNDLEWLRRHRVKAQNPNFDSVKLIRAMRDDYRY